MLFTKKKYVFYAGNFTWPVARYFIIIISSGPRHEKVARLWFKGTPKRKKLFCVLALGVENVQGLSREIKNGLIKKASGTQTGKFIGTMFPL